MMTKREYEREFCEMYGDEVYDYNALEDSFDEKDDCDVSEIDFSGETDLQCGNDERTSDEASCEYDAVFGSGSEGEKGKRNNKEAEEIAVSGITYLPNGKPVYSGIFHNNGRTPDAALVHNDICYVFERIREEKITEFEELQSTSVYIGEMNLYDSYGKALRNAVRFMVSSSGNIRGLVLQQRNRSNGRIDFEEATDYAIEKFLFRPSFFNIVATSSLSPEVTVRVVMSFVERAIKDCAKHHKVSLPDISELSRDLECGNVRKKYVPYDVSSDAPIGNGEDSAKRGDSIKDAESEEGFKAVELISCVKSYIRLLERRKIPQKQIDIFRLKATRFLERGEHITPAEIASELNISVQTVYSAIKKIDELYMDFAKYLAS